MEWEQSSMKGDATRMGNQRAVTDLIRTADGLELDFAREDLGHPQLAGLSVQLEAEVYQHCKAVKPLIVCRTFGHPMYLKRHDGRLVPRHVTDPEGEIDHGESDEHKACKDRAVRMAEERGLTAFTESSLTAAGARAKGRRNDVLIRGEVTVGYEAQYSDITATVVTRRLNLGRRDGVTVYFGTPRESRAARSIVDRAPAGTYNYIPALEISRGKPMPIVSGVRGLRRWRCSDEPHLCPLFGTGRLCKASWHSDYGRPLGRIEQDDLLYGLAISEFVPVCLPSKAGGSWQIVPAISVQDYLSDGGTLVEVPSQRRRSAQRLGIGLTPEENPECAREARRGRPAGVLVEFEHGGVVWGIPADLIGLQRAWYAEHAAVSELVNNGELAALEVARAHRLDLTERKWNHPWLRDAMRDGRRLQADEALKAAARAADVKLTSSTQASPAQT